MRCSICKRDIKTRYIDLYVFGSEGVRLCRPCENEVSGLVLNFALEKQRQRKAEHVKRRDARRRIAREAAE